MPSVVHVAVGVLIDDANCVLLARRQKGTHLEGYWEFPVERLNQARLSRLLWHAS